MKFIMQKTPLPSNPTVYTLETVQEAVKGYGGWLLLGDPLKVLQG